ncbi:hypothetical protein [Demequina litorisediminis]|uniref:Uncharacterized protein n=1 Tax=Demequina litorisediminis TaxID=1849022 RepID=A0ABQ6ID55_9MICO|nr:hypothetical protein [Demequina litorisediminis]GMA35117.1 hypothetical protein GCM10025876_13210 [Demequina litorisediminis]
MDYAYDAATQEFTDLTVAGIAAECVGEPISVIVESAGGSTLFTSAAAATVTGGTTTFAGALAGNAISTDLGDVTVVIG